MNNDIPDIESLIKEGKLEEYYASLKNASNVTQTPPPQESNLISPKINIKNSEPIDVKEDVDKISDIENKVEEPSLDNIPNPLEQSQYKTLDFENYALLISFFDKDITSGQTTLHPWQYEISKELCPMLDKPTKLKPLKYCLVASNGSGKDAYTVAPFSIWFIITKIRSRVIITSSSGTQLTSQTENYIKSLALKVNTFFGEEVFKIRQRYIFCNWSGSEIRMFATDEAGKAEGYHPLDSNSEMALIVNEAKSVSEEIHNALRRCTGFNYWIEVSTPGNIQGFFYRAATDIRLKWKTRTVTSYDCPHIPLDEIESDKIELGETSALFRSKHLAQFTSIDSDVIIEQDLINKLIACPPSYSILNWPTRVGIDLAAGGDENAICFTKGNKCIKEVNFVQKDTTITADVIECELIKMGIPKDHKHIYADDGGVGRSIIDMLCRSTDIKKGWNIKRILNQSAAFNKKQYGNRGAEMWYFIKRLCEEQLFDISTLSPKTIQQLATRRFKQVTSGRVFLESKKEAKAEGRLSPDRADAYVLSLCGLKVEDFLEATTKDNVGSKNATRRMMTQNELLTHYDEVTFKNLEIKYRQQNNSSSRYNRNSLRYVLNNDDNNVIDIKTYGND